MNRHIIAELLPALDRDLADLVAKYAPQPGPDGTVSAEAAHAFRASALRTLLLASAGLAVQARRLGLVFTERDFVEAARRDYRFVADLERGATPPGARS